ncbi:hypothetical protein ACFE04_020697 [Oxalis oulophora]
MGSWNEDELVCNLFAWEWSLVEKIFKVKLKFILYFSLPYIKRGQEDSLQWNLDKSGCYSTKARIIIKEASHSKTPDNFFEYGATYFSSRFFNMEKMKSSSEEHWFKDLLN